MSNVYLCEDSHGRFLTNVDKFPNQLEVHEYQDPGELEGVDWVDDVLDGLGIERLGVGRGLALMWLIDKRPEIVADRLRRIREEFEAGIAPMERLLKERSAH